MKPQVISRPSYRVGPLIVDGRTGEVKNDGKRIPLSETEFNVLYQIVERRGELILRHEIEPWKRESTTDQRNPVEMVLTQIRKQVGDSFILTRNRGYRISPEFVVEVIPSPSLSTLERQLDIAFHQVSDHSSASFRAAIKNCEELILAGKISEAYAVLALAYINLGSAGFCQELPSVVMPKAKSIINEALKWYPTFGTAYALRGLISFIYDYSWSKAESDFRKSLKLTPQNELGHCFLAHLLVAKGTFREGLKHARKAAELDYDSAVIVATEPWLMIYAGKIGDAVIKAKEAAKFFDQIAPAHVVLGNAYRAAGDNKRALEEYNNALTKEAVFPEALGARGFVFGQIGRREEALETLDILRKAKEDGKIAYASSYVHAQVYAGLGEKKKALDALDRCFVERCDWLVHLAVEPRWSELRNEKRFKKLIRRVRIPKLPQV